MRAPCCEKMGLKKGPWTPEEDQILISYIQRYGHENWRALPKQAGLMRCGKSCRLRWTNYLRPDIKRGNFSREEEETIIKLHQILGNRWSAIATGLPGRTDNEIKNFWHTHLKKRLIKKDLATPNTGGHSTVTTKWETNDMRKSEPAIFSRHPKFSSLSHAPVSAQNFSDNFSSSDPSMVTTTRPIQEEHMKGIRSIPEINLNHLAKDSGAVDPRLQFLSSKESAMEPIAAHNSNISNDMIFWYNLFVKAGESQNR